MRNPISRTGATRHHAAKSEAHGTADQLTNIAIQVTLDQSPD
jgi:hypothetical protein